MPKQPRLRGKRDQTHARLLKRLVIASRIADHSYGSYKRIENEFGVHRALARYWWRKYHLDGFHPNGIGGRRKCCFTSTELPAIELLALALQKAQPYGSTKEKAQYISEITNR